MNSDSLEAEMKSDKINKRKWAHKSKEDQIALLEHCSPKSQLLTLLWFGRT